MLKKLLDNKKLIKRLIIVLGVIIFLLLIYIIRDRMLEQRIPVLTYHGVVNKIENNDGVDISLKYFEKQMEWLDKHDYKTITMDEFYKWKKGEIKLPRKSILIVFDDGWRNNYNNALQVLYKYNMKASIFVVWKYSESSSNDEKPVYITDDDILYINENYKNIELLSHSYDLHIKELAESGDYDVYDNDIKKVKSLNKNIQYYAYPFGYTNEEYMNALSDNGCKLAFTFGPYDFASVKDDDLKIPRIGVFESTSFSKLKLKLYLNSYFKI